MIRLNAVTSHTPLEQKNKQAHKITFLQIEQYYFQWKKRAKYLYTQTAAKSSVNRCLWMHINNMILLFKLVFC